MATRDQVILQRARRVFDIEIDALRQVRSQQGKPFCQAIALFLDCLARRRKIVVSGIGKSELIGRKISATLTSTGAPSVVLDATDALHGELGVVAEGDMILLLSNSGETEELLRVLPMLRRFDIKIISILGRLQSTLARHSDVVLHAHVRKEACPHNLAPTASTTAMLALGDALAMVVLEERGFRKEDFARFHPGGSLGQSLLLKVTDLMRARERFAIISEKSRVKEALGVMSRARSGCVAVVDARGRLAGIFTHGDFARHYAENQQIGEVPIRTVMTRRPIVIRADALAAEALHVLQTHSIDDLIVVDRHLHPLGLIDSQDLPRLKLV
ncbi:MAG: KpsF/GutQ family sugar-phosphate isomerase [Verrucomicrobiae bacterium]|nr:KpsF/GutQ family sugar-phosphate isomerase [Verrucomicrobiae bacterium]